MIPFRLFQISHTSAQTPTRIRILVFLSIPFNHLPKKFLMLVGGGKLKVKCTTRHTSLANRQRMKS
jgi:hypothetical protein